jgi:serine/threonine-protein kinase
MEHLRGESLTSRLGIGKMPALQAVRIIQQCAIAMAAAHARGIIHRDLKPDNVFLVADPAVPGGERIKILDFGIAKLLGERGSRRAKTHGGAILGTPAYMAPEQCKGGGTVDARADLYATGCILFEMLAGRPPFVAEGEGEVIAMHIYEPPPRLTALSRGAPVELDALLAKMLQKSADDRVPSAAWALAALERVALPPLGRVEIVVPAFDRGQFAVSLPKPPREGLPKWVPIAMLVVALVIAVVAIFVIGGSGHALAPR